MRAAEKSDEFFQLAGLLTKISGGADQPGQTDKRNPVNSARREQLGAAKLGDSALHIRPGGVLSQDSANDDFKTGGP
jgi:hypothetical protein